MGCTRDSSPEPVQSPSWPKFLTQYFYVFGTQFIYFLFLANRKYPSKEMRALYMLICHAQKERKVLQDDPEPLVLSHLKKSWLEIQQPARDSVPWYMTGCTGVDPNHALLHPFRFTSEEEKLYYPETVTLRNQSSRKLKAKKGLEKRKDTTLSNTHTRTSTIQKHSYSSALLWNNRDCTFHHKLLFRGREKKSSAKPL